MLSSNAGERMVHLTGISKSYLNSPRVLDQIQLEVGRGEFLYLLGGSGAGKSTLLRILATEEAPTQGMVQLFGYDIAKASASTLSTIRQAIGYVPQDLRLIPDLTVYENVGLSLSFCNKRVVGAAARKQIEDALERTGMIHRKDILAESLSGGEAQRVAVARALVRKPELILADEPTGAQDRDHTWSLMDLFLRANLTGTSVIVATHDREMIRRVRKRSAILNQGKIQFEDQLCIY